MESPQFSIIIPTFNSEETLEVALKSIAEQTYKNVEVVIQDGISNDQTLKIVENFQKQLNLSIVSEKDTGIYDAMNKAMKRASGNWLFFMGSDDSFYHSEVLKNVSDILKNTSSMVVYGNAKIVGDTGWAEDGEIYAGKFTIEKLLNQNICHQAIFYHREKVLEKVGFYNIAYAKSADWDYNLKCWAKHPFQYADMIVANFYSGGLSTNSTDHKIEDDFVNNVLTYFDISPFDRLVNNPTFIYYKKVLAKQEQHSPLRFKWEHFKKRLKRKIKRK